MSSVVQQSYDWFIAELRAFVLTPAGEALGAEVNEDMAVADFVKLAADGKTGRYLNVVEDTAVEDGSLLGATAEGFGEEKEFYQPAVVEWVVINPDLEERKAASDAGLVALAAFYDRLQDPANLPDVGPVSSVDMNRPPVRGPRGIPAQIKAVSVTFDMLLSASSFLG